MRMGEDGRPRVGTPKERSLQEGAWVGRTIPSCLHGRSAFLSGVTAWYESEVVYRHQMTSERSGRFGTY
jgi:hypothetical protein